MVDLCNVLLPMFGVYNAVVLASDGTLVFWNNTLGLSFRPFGYGEMPTIDLSEYPAIKAQIDEFARNGGC